MHCRTIHAGTSRAEMQNRLIALFLIRSNIGGSPGGKSSSPLGTAVYEPVTAVPSHKPHAEALAQINLTEAIFPTSPQQSDELSGCAYVQQPYSRRSCADDRDDGMTEVVAPYTTMG